MVDSERELQDDSTESKIIEFDFHFAKKLKIEVGSSKLKIEVGFKGLTELSVSLNPTDGCLYVL